MNPFDRTVVVVYVPFSFFRPIEGAAERSEHHRHSHAEGTAASHSSRYVLQSSREHVLFAVKADAVCKWHM